MSDFTNVIKNATIDEAGKHIECYTVDEYTQLIKEATALQVHDYAMVAIRMFMDDKCKPMYVDIDILCGNCNHRVRALTSDKYDYIEAIFGQLKRYRSGEDEPMFSSVIQDSIPTSYTEEQYEKLAKREEENGRHDTFESALTYVKNNTLTEHTEKQYRSTINTMVILVDDPSVIEFRNAA